MASIDHRALPFEIAAFLTMFKQPVFGVSLKAEANDLLEKIGKALNEAQP